MTWTFRVLAKQPVDQPPEMHALISINDCRIFCHFLIKWSETAIRLKSSVLGNFEPSSRRFLPNDFGKNRGGKWVGLAAENGAD